MAAVILAKAMPTHRGESFTVWNNAKKAGGCCWAQKYHLNNQSVLLWKNLYFTDGGIVKDQAAMLSLQEKTFTDGPGVK